MMRANWLWTLRVSASTSGESGTTSGSASNSPNRYGSSVTGSRSRTRCSPWTRMRSVPSGTLINLCTTATVPTSYTSSQPGGSASTFFTVSEGQHPLAGDDVVDQLDRALLADGERRHRLGEDDRLLQREDGELSGQLLGDDVLELAHAASRR